MLLFRKFIWIIEEASRGLLRSLTYTAWLLIKGIVMSISSYANKKNNKIIITNRNNSHNFLMWEGDYFVIKTQPVKTVA